MTEILVRDGTWTFDHESVRVVPGRERRVHKLRQFLGERAVPLEAIAGIAYEPARKGGRLRLRLRPGADPLIEVSSGKLADASDPYQLVIDADRKGAAEFFADDVRNTLTIEQVPSSPTDRYLLAAPPPPRSAAGQGLAHFDGHKVRLEWDWTSEESKRNLGPQEFVVDEIETVEWSASNGLDWGFVRFRLKGARHDLPPNQDPACLRLWDTKKSQAEAVLLAAAVAERLPHPYGRTAIEAATPVTAAPTDTGESQDDVLRRLRELGELHKDGVLSDDEFTAAKQALLRRL